jgi:RNA polymerase sigma-70 factor (ECF subfamily)
LVETVCERGATKGAEDISLTEPGADNSAADGPGPNTEKFLSLLGAHERSLFAYVYALVPGWQDAEEVMQRLRIRIWQQFDQYETDKPFEAWARAIAYYLVLAYRKEKCRQREFFVERVLEAVSSQYEKHLENSHERRDALVGCLDKLDGRKRELVQDYYSSAKQSAETMAEKLSMTPNAVRQSLFRIRKTLLDCVERTLRVESRGGQQ